MKRYDNLSGDSGVAAYEIRRGAIVVEFVDGAAYLYTDASARAGRIAEMQRLAEAGRGLSTFISRAQPEYAKRLR
ncbi:MAG: hypothetical protein ACREP1_08935 [Rhodanobacteraceae bacterium]